MSEMVLAVGMENCTIRYFKTSGELLCEENQNKKTPVYGVAAKKYIDDKEEESADAGFISEDAAYVDNLIALLGKHTVTPVVLCEVLDEMLS